MIFGSKVEDFEHRQDEMSKAKLTLKKAKELESKKKLKPFRYDASTIVYLPNKKAFEEWKNEYENRKILW